MPNVTSRSKGPFAAKGQSTRPAKVLSERRQDHDMTDRLTTTALKRAIEALDEIIRLDTIQPGK